MAVSLPGCPASLTTWHCGLRGTRSWTQPLPICLFTSPFNGCTPDSRIAGRTSALAGPSLPGPQRAQQRTQHQTASDCNSSGSCSSRFAFWRRWRRRRVCHSPSVSAATAAARNPAYPVPPFTLSFPRSGRGLPKLQHTRPQAARPAAPGGPRRPSAPVCLFRLESAVQRWSPQQAAAFRQQWKQPEACHEEQEDFSSGGGCG